MWDEMKKVLKPIREKHPQKCNTKDDQFSSEFLKRVLALYQLDLDMRNSMENAISKVPTLSKRLTSNIGVSDAQTELTDAWMAELSKLPVIRWFPHQQALIGCLIKLMLLDTDFGTGK